MRRQLGDWFGSYLATFITGKGGAICPTSEMTQPKGREEVESKKLSSAQ